MTKVSSEGGSAIPVKQVVGPSAPVKSQENTAADLFAPREVIVPLPIHVVSLSVVLNTWSSFKFASLLHPEFEGSVSILPAS